MTPHSSYFLHDAGLLIPKVRPIDLDVLPFLFRWCFDDSELQDLWASGGLLDLKGLDADVSFRLASKIHRRREFKELAGKSGWLRVAIGNVPDEPQGLSHYLLFSAFTEIGVPVEFATLNSLFDHQVSVGPLGEVPPPVDRRLRHEIGLCQEMSSAHLRERVKRTRQTEINELQEACAGLTEEVEARLKQLNDMVRTKAVVGSSRSDDAHTESSLRKERTLARIQLVEAESAELHSLRELLHRHSQQRIGITASTLYTINWNVYGPH